MRVCLKFPTAAIDRLDTTNTTANSQLAQILDTFNWDSLPFKFDFDCRQHKFGQLTIQLSDEANAKLKKYCLNNRKSKTVAVAQALIHLGLYQI